MRRLIAAGILAMSAVLLGVLLLARPSQQVIETPTSANTPASQVSIGTPVPTGD